MGLRLGSWRHLKVSSRSTGSEFLLPGMREKAGKFSNFFLSLMMSILTKTVLKRLALIEGPLNQYAFKGDAYVQILYLYS